MAETRADRAAARRARAGERLVSARQPAHQPAVESERKRGNFIKESYGELKKVEWPGQSQVIQGTIVVLVACLVVGAYLYVNDTIWKHVVSKVFLGQ
jgi:preprotein translocase subunit SecE